MRTKLLCALGALGFLTTAQAAHAVCGDNNLEVGEQCDDNNIANGDGCSSLCQTEDAFVCEEVSFALFSEEQLAGGTTPNWNVDADRRGVSQTTNSQAAVFNTNMEADLSEIVFDMRVFTGSDNDFMGFTIGYDNGEMTATAPMPPQDIDYLYFSWKQGQQNFGGVRQPGFIASRVEGPASAQQYWNGRLGNITQIAEANSYPLGGGNGWDDNRWYRVNVQVLPNRVRVWVREGNTSNTTNQNARGFGALDRTSDLEFDLAIDVPRGKFGLYAMSQTNIRYELVAPLLASECSSDTDRDGVKDTTDLDSDRDGILDSDEMPGFPTDPDADSDLDGIPDWNDPDQVPGGCPSAAGMCTSLPAAFDADGDGVPNHLDKDADGDGITDVREAGLIDADGNGTPDTCTMVNAAGVCNMGALAEPATNTDMMDSPDFLDADSDGDGLTDLIEAHDTSGNAMADVTPSGFDTDGDGIDDAYDPDCLALTCMGRIGVPVLGILTPAQDSNLDGTPDWQTLCGDAYRRGAEGCDDGNTIDADMCNNACLVTNGNGCTANGECDSTTCDGDLMTCQVCDDTTVDGRDRGCTNALPACATSAGVNMCVECTGNAQCGGGQVCVGMMCVFCSDDMAGTGTDIGCTDAAPLCDTSGAIPTCRRCVDDAAGGADTGCTAAAPVCDPSTGTGSCIQCEDSEAGTAMDFGCGMPGQPVCLEPLGMAPMCVECAQDDHCTVVGELCGPDNSCVPGCNDQADCDGTPLPICDVPNRVCVECLSNADCSGDELCGLGVCALPDSDMDGISDDVDLDDDNDGVLDIDEGSGSDRSVDSDGDGWPDYKDPDVVACEDVDADGACDALPVESDFDQDGVPNQLDLDADGDGIADIVEGGGTDVEGDGLVDGFVDADRNGVDDVIDMTALPVPDTDEDGAKDFLDLDSDADGLTDTFEAGGTDADGDGQPDGASVDGDGDGWNDLLAGVNVLPLTNTDGDDAPDYVDVDSDDDGVEDVIEGHIGVAPSGADTDGDGIDDAFDADCVDALCGGVIGMVSTVPNTDANGAPDFRDIDSDGDGILDSVECPVSAMCADSDMDGTLDFRALDADGDGIPDATEGHDADHDGTADAEPVGSDTDGDGLDDAFDADCMDAAPCPGGIVGMPAPTPDLDMNGTPNFQDPDDDGDTILTATEVMDAAEYVGPAATPTDVDEDGLPNWYDENSDGDDTSDMAEDSRPELDGDVDDNGILDYLDPNFAPRDTDGDGLIDALECPGVAVPDDTCPDTDMDGQPDYDDVDDDNDGILTSVEYSADDPMDGDPANDHDADNDGVPNHRDLDADNDGIPDLWENGGAALDANGDGLVDMPVDADMDGLLATFDADDADAEVTTAPMPINTDAVGGADYLDLDADGDGLLDIFEADGTDMDGNGVVDDAADADMDGLADVVDGSPWGTPDTDEDGSFDFQDIDSDGDSIPDATEAHDVDGDGGPDVVAGGADANGNGIDDAFDPALGGSAAAVPDHDEDMIADWRDTDDDGDGVPSAIEVLIGDTDRDGTPDYLDVDDDGDGVATRLENPDPDADGEVSDAQDTDENGTPDYLDNDDDGDGVLTSFENPDPNADGDVSDAQDTDGNGTPDYLDPDDDGDGALTEDEMADPDGDGDPMDAVDTDGNGIPDYLDPSGVTPTTGGGLAGGAFCSATPETHGASLPGWMLLGLALFGWRRRR